MKKYTLDQFINHETDEGDYRIYAIFDGEDCLYVGKASLGVWARWFGRGGHIQKNIAGKWFGTSPIGKKIVKNIPTSLKWVIEMHTVKDCKNDILTFVCPHFKRLDIDSAEIALIKKYRPKLNIIYNL